MDKLIFQWSDSEGGGEGIHIGCHSCLARGAFPSVNTRASASRTPDAPSRLITQCACRRCQCLFVHRRIQAGHMPRHQRCPCPSQLVDLEWYSSEPHQVRSLYNWYTYAVGKAPPASLNVSSSLLECENSIVSLGVSIDSGLHIRPALSMKMALRVGRAIILSRLDYCNALLYGTSETNVARLQRFQNRLVRMVIRHARMEMHWLPVRERILYKLAVLTRAASRTRQPTYLAGLLVDQVAPRLLQSASDTMQLVVPRTRDKKQTLTA